MEKIVKKAIHWEKWVDPLNSNVNEVDPLGHKPVHPNDIEYYDFSENDTAVKDTDEAFFRDLGSRIHSIKPLKVVNTKMGLLTVTENAMAGTHFDFWTMHANFPITEKVANVICEATGVDAFMPLTRYRCRIGFPRSGLFSITDCKLNIQKLLTEDAIVDSSGETQQIFSDEVKVKIDTKISELKERSKYWALFVLPNGGMEILESESPGSIYKDKLGVLSEAQKLVGGQLFQS